MLTNHVKDHELYIGPDHVNLSYMGRIDDSNPKAPCLVFASSQIRIRFKGTSLKIILRNYHGGYDNFLGYLIDNSSQGKIKLNLDNDIYTYTIAENLDDKEHDIIIFKRQDSAHYFDFLGFILNKDAIILDLPAKPIRKIECYGDSVSAGEVSEAIDYVGVVDPEHNGELSNSWYSYASIAARKLNAQLHNVSQGGIALLDNTGYFYPGNYTGMINTYDKLHYNEQIMPTSLWDFSKYTPHLVLVAIGQNDSHPEDYMGKDEEKSQYWIKNYKDFVSKIRLVYPDATIILKTTILSHSRAWDEAIASVQADLNDPKIHYFAYSNNSCGTNGHIRIPEAEQMATELVSFINNLDYDVWT